MPSLQKSGGLRFNGTSDYVDSVGTLPSFSFVQKSGLFVLEAWIKLSNPNSQTLNIILGNTGSSTESGFFFGFENRGGVGTKQLRLDIFKGQSGNSVISSMSPTNIINDSNWHHVITIGNSINVSFFVDGVQFAGTNTMASLSSVDSNRTLNFGRYPFSVPGGYFQGTIGATRIYNRALSPSEVQMNYQGQVIRDASLVGEWLLNATSGTVATDTSGNGNHGTLNGGQWGTQATKKKPKKNLIDKTNPKSALCTVTQLPNGINLKGSWYVEYPFSVGIGATVIANWDTQVVSGSVANVYRLYYTDGTLSSYINKGVSIVVSKDVSSVYVYLEISGSNAEANYTNLQLEQGSTATPFEPYQLIPDLASVKTKPKKNMVDLYNSMRAISPANVSVVQTDGRTNAVKMVGGASWLNQNWFPNTVFKLNTRYTLTFDYKYESSINTTQGVFPIIYYTDGTSDTLNIPWTTVFTKSIVTSAIGKTISYISSTYGTGTTNTYFDQFQLEEGVQSTAFEPYSLVPDLPLAPQGKIAPYRGTDFTFARPSVEPYSGLTVPMDTPRVDGNGVIVEEGTSNLWVQGGKPTSYNPLPTGFNISGLAILSSTTYTVTFQAKSNSGGTVLLTTNNRNLNPVKLSNVFSQYTYTFTSLGTETALYIYDQNSNGDIIIKNAQLEQKTYATTFTDNPLGRQAETLTFPTANVLNASAGTIEVWAYEDTVQRLGFILDSANAVGTNSGNRFLLYKNTNSYGVFTGGASRITTSTISSKGFHLYSIKWVNSTIYLYIDGVNVGQSAMPTLIFDSLLLLGAQFNPINNYQWNNPIKSLRISNVARSDQEILDSFNKSQAYMHLPFDDSTTKLLNF